MSAISPLLQPWSGPYGGVPPWDQIDPNEFEACFSQAIEDARAEMERIVDNPEPASFQNTIEALEIASRGLDQLRSMFGVYTSNLNRAPIPDIQRVVMPKLAAFGDEMVQNERLFARIKAVHDAADRANLTEVQHRLLSDRYRSFVRQGSELNQPDKTKLADINQQLTSLYTEFAQNVLNDEAGYVTWVEDEAQLAGLSASVIDGMASAAAERGRPEAWAVANTRAAMDPFLTYADDRTLREQVWRTYYGRGDNSGPHDNKPIITKILKLRATRAQLLGYKTHAHWRLEVAMAKTPEAAMDLMLGIWPKALTRSIEEVADMQELANAEAEQQGTDASPITIEPWDYRHYAEKVRKAKYDLDLNEVVPYLQLENLVEAMLWCSTELYGLTYSPVDDVPVFHPDVRVWSVTGRDGAHVGLWYLDPYAREGKLSGAWMTAYRSQENMTEPISTLVSNNSNFVKGRPGEPVLISWDDATTLFHEFGHALHGLLSNVRYPSQSGTSVARDYVEFPSQINEHWLTTPEVLNRFCLHYQSGEPMPADLIDKIHRAATFNQGFDTVEYLSAALIDMELHLAGDQDIDPAAFERDALERLGMPSAIVMRHRTPQFAHVFSGDSYSAGYYSYLWADALTADAAEAFSEAGGFFDTAVAARLHDNVFSVGDTIDPAEGFRAFRGRDVDPEALLRKRGLPVG